MRSPRPPHGRRGLPTALACLVLLPLVLTGCSGGDDLRPVRIQIQKGDLEAAQRLLASAEGSRADQLRDKVELMLERRAEIETRIDEVFAGLGRESPTKLRGQLEHLLFLAQEPGARDLVKKAQSDLSDRIASGEGRIVGPPEAGTLPTASAARATAGAASTSGDLDISAMLRRDLELAIRERQWARGTTLQALLAEHVTETGEELGSIGLRLQDEAGAEMRRLLDAARAIEEQDGLEASIASLEAELERFPRERSLALIHNEVDDLRAKLADRREASSIRITLALEEGDESEPFLTGSDVLVPDAEADELAQLARDREQRGDLAGARILWLAASRDEYPGSRREALVGQAIDLRARLELRIALRDALQADPLSLGDLGVSAVDDTGWVRDGEPVAWAAVTYEELDRAASLLELGRHARRGLFVERLLALDGSDEIERALSDLARQVDRGEIDAAAAASMVMRARSRGSEGRELQPYVLYEGRWVTKADVDAEEYAKLLTRLEKAFVRADVDERDAAFEALVSTGERAAVSRALKTRYERARKVLVKGGTYPQLERLAELRRELDLARKDALTAIFDEETYFYPYNPPTPPKTAGDYARAQREVDELVGEVRDVWKRSKAVKVPAAFREALAEVAWHRDLSAELELELRLEEPVPDWMFELPAELDEIDLATFAWDEWEADDLALSRRVRAHNERVWKGVKNADFESEDSLPDVSEMNQVRITNDYRVLLGRRALAWNPNIQAAAQGHSDYMANTGDFGHFEKDPERYGPGDRMKLAGYAHGASENCAMNGGGPEGAHVGWTHSSGHHRNLLMEGHREMASGVAGSYWTQNFGRGTEFLGELD